MRHRRLVLTTVALVAAGAGLVLLPNYLVAAALVARVGHVGGYSGTWAARQAWPVVVEGRREIPTRHGLVAMQLYHPSRDTTRTVLLVPGIHSMGIEEPRLTGLARDLAAAGLLVVAMALPDLQRYRITPNATDVIEDAVSWLARQPRFAPDGRVGVVGISFAGGLSIAAAERPAVADRLAFVASLGGHGDLSRVMRYLATGETPYVEGLAARPPHDYGVAVVLFALAERVVPGDQVASLRDGVETFLLASQLTLQDRDEADATFARARQMADAMPEPARTYMGYVNDRVVARLGLVLEPHLADLGTDEPALSPEHSARPPACPVFLLHGRDDTVVPASESALLGAWLRDHGAQPRVLLSALVTHAELNDAITVVDAWHLVSFWADMLGR